MLFMMMQRKNEYVLSLTSDSFVEKKSRNEPI